MDGKEKSKRFFASTIVLVFFLGSVLPLLSIVPEEASAVAEPFYEDFESGAEKWTMDGLWDWESSPVHSMFGACVHYGPYDTGDRNEGNMTLQVPLDLSDPDFSHAYLSFWYYLGIETDRDHSGYENVSVHMSKDSGDHWSEVALLSDTHGEWKEIIIDVSEYCGSTQVLIKFYFDSRDDWMNDYDGWYLDNIKVFPPTEGFILEERHDKMMISVHDFASGPESRMAPFQGSIMMEVDPSEHLRGVSLASESLEYVVETNATVTISAYAKNLDDTSTKTLTGGLRVYNRFAKLVHVAWSNFTIQQSSRYTFSFDWTPSMPDYYLVVVYVSERGYIPVIDPYVEDPGITTALGNGDISGGWAKTRFRPLHVFDTFMDDDVEDATGSNVSADWTGEVGEITGNGHLNPGGEWGTDKLVYDPDTGEDYPVFHGIASSGQSWLGGDFNLAPRNGVQHNITSREVDISELYWVYGMESSAHYLDEALVGDSTPRLYFSFYYCYRMSTFLGLAESFGQLHIQTYTTDHKWSEWTPIWNTADNPHQFEPANKLNWVEDLDEDLPTKVDITEYIPSLLEYDEGLKVRFQFRVSTSGGLFVGDGWALDDLQLLGVTPRYGLGMSSNSPQTANKSISETIGFQCSMDNTGNMGGSGWSIDMEHESIPRNLSTLAIEGWDVEQPSENPFLSVAIVGAERFVFSYVITTISVPDDEILIFRIWSNMTDPEHNIVAQASVDLILRVGEGDLSMTADTLEQYAEPGETVAYHLTILNKIFDESRTITLSNLDVNPAWAVVFEEGSFVLAPGAEKTVSVDITAPPSGDSALPGRYMSLAITARNGPVEDNGTEAVSVWLNTTINETYRLELGADPDTVDARKGHTSTIIFTAHNTGNVGGDVVMSTVAVSPGLNMFDVNIIPGSGFIQRFQSASFSVRLDVPEDIPEGMYSVTVEGDLAEGNATDQITLFFDVSNSYLVDVVSQGDTVQTAVDDYGYEPMKYPFRVYNNGTISTDITLSVIATSEVAGWVESLPTMDDVNETSDNNGEMFNATVTPTGDKLEAGNYPFVIKATPTGDPEQFDAETFTVIVPARYEVDLLTPTETNVDMSIGVEESVTFELENLGNAVNRIDLSHNLDTDCWTVWFKVEGVASSYFDVDPFDSVFVEFVCVASTDAVAGEYPVTITGVCREDSGEEDAISLNIDLIQEFDLQISGYVTDASFDPEDDEPAIFKFYVENTGNGNQNVDFSYDLFFKGSLVGDTSDWTVTHSVDGSSGSVDLESGENVTVEVKVDPPTDALAGTYTLKSITTVTGASETDSIDLTLEIEASHDITLRLIETEVKVDAGGKEKKLSFEITNDGNTDEEITITVEPIGDAKANWVSYAGTVTVQAGEKEVLEVTIKVPEGIGTDTYSFSIQIEAEDVTPETDDFEVEVTGTSDSVIPTGLSSTEIGIIAIVMAVVIVLILVALKTGKPKKPSSGGEPQEPTPEPEAPEMRMNM